MIRRFLTNAFCALAIFAGAFPVAAQQPVQWNYSFDASGNAWARYPGGVTAGSPTGGALGIGTINATGLYVNGVAVGAATVCGNPTATIGLTAVNGAAATCLRSDGAPALSQAIVPTWTGIHTFNASPVFNGSSVTFANAANWRTSLGLGTLATQNANAVTITGGTIGGLSSPLATTSGGTGVTTGPQNVLISQSTYSASGGPTVVLPNTYKRYKLVIWQTWNTANGFPGMQFSYDNGATWKTAATDYKYSGTFSTGAVGSTTASTILMSGTQDVSATLPMQLDCDILVPSASIATSVICRSQNISTGGSATGLSTGYTTVIYGVPTNVRWVPSAGTMTGAYALYGSYGL